MGASLQPSVVVNRNSFPRPSSLATPRAWAPVRIATAILLHCRTQIIRHTTCVTGANHIKLKFRPSFMDCSRIISWHQNCAQDKNKPRHNTLQDATLTGAANACSQITIDLCESRTASRQPHFAFIVDRNFLV